MIDTTTPEKEQAETKPDPFQGSTKGAPIPDPGKNLVRFRVPGIVDKIPDMLAFVKGLECDEGLKSFMISELQNMAGKFNAAEIHLHDIEHVDNSGEVIGFSVHLQIKGRVLGSTKGAVFKRNP